MNCTSLSAYHVSLTEFSLTFSSVNPLFLQNEKPCEDSGSQWCCILSKQCLSNFAHWISHSIYIFYPCSAVNLSCTVINSILLTYLLIIFCLYLCFLIHGTVGIHVPFLSLIEQIDRIYKGKWYEHSWLYRPLKLVTLVISETIFFQHSCAYQLSIKKFNGTRFLCKHEWPCGHVYFWQSINVHSNKPNITYLLPNLSDETSHATSMYIEGLHKERSSKELVWW